MGNEVEIASEVESISTFKDILKSSVVTAMCLLRVSKYRKNMIICQCNNDDGFG